MKTVAIVGRTNVGKSTLFNRLCHRKLAIVHDKPGVTRDRKEATATLDDKMFCLVDTAGLEAGGDLEKSMWAQTRQAIRQADVIMMLVDVRAGVHPLDEQLATELHKYSKPVLLVANKCEGREQEELLYDFYKLALGEPIPFSAEHGRGVGELASALLPLIEQDEGEDSAEKSEEKKAIRLAIVGRPNVGKSTLINHILQEERLLTGPMAGVTRDAIEVPFSWEDTPFVLIDTAGLRKRSKVNDSLEKMAGSHTTNAINFATVVVLVLDATSAMERQDIAIAVKAFEEGRALVIGLNKWDLVTDSKKVLKDIADTLSTSLQQVKGIPVVPLSGKTGYGVKALMQRVLETYEKWDKRVPTHKVNLFLKEMIEKHLPPVAKNGRRIPLKYMTQVSSRPPSFVIFSSNPQELPESYVRYLTNGLRSQFGFEGIPLRLTLRKQKNPYAK